MLAIIHFMNQLWPSPYTQICPTRRWWIDCNCQFSQNMIAIWFVFWYGFGLFNQRVSFFPQMWLRCFNIRDCFQVEGQINYVEIVVLGDLPCSLVYFCSTHIKWKNVNVMTFVFNTFLTVGDRWCINEILFFLLLETSFPLICKTRFCVWLPHQLVKKITTPNCCCHFNLHELSISCMFTITFCTLAMGRFI